jgi:hypothetical protein
LEGVVWSGGFLVHRFSGDKRRVGYIINMIFTPTCCSIDAILYRHFFTS